ncbi:MAG: EAL domain-containing protein [Chloroflexi bacterium]|nr:EAL domain-containing protein [Chloroflexota bacterium]
MNSPGNSIHPQLFRHLAHSPADCIWTRNGHFQFVYVGPALSHWRGYSVGEASVQSLDQMVTPESARRLAALVDRAANLTKNPSSVNIGLQSWTIELELCRKDGSTVWAESTLNILTDERGQPSGTLRVMREITERKQAEGAFRQRIAELETRPHGRAAFTLRLDRERLETEMCRALERQEFVLYYQPVICATTGRITSVEALARWEHPERGLLLPDEFIPLAEASNLIVPLGDWILRAACAQLKAWHRAGFRELQVAVNVSPRQFQMPRLAARIQEILDETGLPPSALQLEITESIAMIENEQSALTLAELHALGVQLSIDDFGNGYATLGNLRRYPVKILKIDNSFIRNVPEDRDSAVITTAVIELARTLKLRVIAEGVETAGQLDFLRSRACDEIQGFLFSRPLPADEITMFLQDRPGDYLEPAGMERLCGETPVV